MKGGAFGGTYMGERGRADEGGSGSCKRVGAARFEWVGLVGRELEPQTDGMLSFGAGGGTLACRCGKGIVLMFFNTPTSMPATASSYNIFTCKRPTHTISRPEPTHCTLCHSPPPSSVDTSPAQADHQG